MKNTRDWHVFMSALRLVETSAEPYLYRRPKARLSLSRPSVSVGAWFGCGAPAIIASGTSARTQTGATVSRAGTT